MPTVSRARLFDHSLEPNRTEFPCKSKETALIVP